MKPPKFNYHAPRELDEAVALLRQYDGEARLLSGGQSIVPMLNFRLMAPAALIDLSRIPSLSYVRSEDDIICIGGMTRQRTAENSPEVGHGLPLLREALEWTGHLPTRSRGTVGGSLAHADPSAEQPLALLTMDGAVVLHGPSGRRTVAADDFFVSLFTTAIEHDEVLIESRWPRMRPGTGHAVEEFSRRRGDFAIVAIATTVRRDGDRCLEARVAAAGVDARPIRLRQAEATLMREGLDEAGIRAAAVCASQEVTPSSDMNGSEDYRRHLVDVLVARAVTRAAARAQINTDRSE